MKEEKKTLCNVHLDQIVFNVSSIERFRHIIETMFIYYLQNETILKMSEKKNL